MRKKVILARAAAVLTAFTMVFSECGAFMSYAAEAGISGNSVVLTETEDILEETEEETMPETEPAVEAETETEMETETETETESEPEPVMPDSDISGALLSGSSLSDNALSDNSISDSSISDSSISDNSISDNSLETEEELEENTLLWGLTADKQQQAAKELQALLDEQEVTALIYLCDSYALTVEPGADSQTAAVLRSGHQVQITGYHLTEDAFYYIVKTWVEDREVCGYVDREYLAYSDERLLEWEDKWFSGMWLESSDAQIDYSDVEQFPDSYQGNLYELKTAHPNWIFVKMDTGLDWAEVVKYELNASEDRSRSLVPASYPDAWKYAKYNSSWYYASEVALKYCLDPRNFLKETYVFQFEQLTYNESYHTVEGVQNFLNSTFMSGELPGEGMTYAQAFWEIGSSQNVSPYHLASRVYQEQGKGTSPLISGTYAGFEGYYNYFNVSASGATDAEVIRTGLTYAKENEWNTRYKALSGGAAVIAKNYILKGQDTLYLQKFDVDDSYSGMYWHQYMQNILAPSSEAQSILKLYKNTGSLDNTFVFRIPVYNNMPSRPCQVEETEELSLEQSSYELKKGDSLTLSVKLNSNTVAPQLLSFASADDTIASVDENGTILAVGAGQTVITVTMEELTVSCRIVVSSPLEGISLVDENGAAADALALNRGDSMELFVSYEPEDTTDSRKVTWICSNTSVLSLTKEAEKVTVAAKAAGQAKITAKVGDHKAECVITVSVPLTGIEFDTQITELYVGQSAELAVNLIPADTTEQVDISWENNNPEVLLLEDGKITGLDTGTAAVSVKAGAFEISTDINVKYCEVTFYDGEDVADVKKVAYSQPIGELPVKDKGDKKLFGGWFTESGGTGLALTSSYKVKKDMAVYGYWMDLDGDMFVEPVSDQYYTGSAIKPDPAVYDSYGRKLEKNKDYAISWKNNTNVHDLSTTAKAPSITITGKGNYTGKKTIYFRILPVDLGDETVTADMLAVSWNGKVQKPAPTVMLGTKKLTAKKDFTVSYPDTESGAYKNPGTWRIVLTGKGNFEGERVVELVITTWTPIAKLKVAKLPAQDYVNAKEGVCPDLTVTDPATGYVLEPEEDYIVSYYNNTSPGTAYALITGGSSGKYTGSKKVTFTIKGTSIAKAKVTGIQTNVTWDGAAVEQPDACLTLTVNGEETILTEADYEVTYQKNDRAGTASVTFTGKGGYTGKIKKTFKIRTCDFGSQSTEVTFTQGSDVFTYEKGGVKPEVTVTVNGQELEKNKDYTLSYSSNNAVNDRSNLIKLPTVKIKGKGNYKGSTSLSFEIIPASLENMTVTAVDLAASASKGKWKSTPVVTDVNGKKLSAGTDYGTVIYTYAEDTEVTNGKQQMVRKAGETVQTADIVPAGPLIDVEIVQSTKANVLNYTGNNQDCSYKITEAAMKAVSVKVVNAPVYTGEDILLSGENLQVTYKGEVLQEGVDYIFLEDTYTKNKVKGKASVTLKGIGRFGGTKKITFSILAKPFTF